MSDLMRNIIQSRAGGKVERCHVIPHQGSYNNAAHSWGVAMLMYQLFPEDYSRLSIYCLVHDVPEAWVGDIPSPTLRYAPGIKEALSTIEGNLNRAIGLPGEDELNEGDLAKLKACDRLEFYLWCRDQLSLGNGNVVEPINEVTKYLGNNPLPAPADEFWLAIKSISTVAAQAGVMERAARGDF